MPGFLRTYAKPETDLQRPAEAAVVLITGLRRTLIAVLRSVFAQAFEGRVHLLIGIDGPAGEADLAVLDRLCAAHPDSCVVQVVHPGYATPVLRAVLTCLANSRYVAYLDDDNSWHPEHLRLLRAAVGEADWAYGLRWFVHPRTGRTICVDGWESVGPGRGIHAERFGGHVDPGCMMIDKLACALAVSWWTVPPAPGAPDRSMFAYLREYHRGAGIGRPTVYHRITPAHPLHKLRLELMGSAYAAAGAG